MRRSPRWRPGGSTSWCAKHWTLNPNPTPYALTQKDEWIYHLPSRMWRSSMRRLPRWRPGVTPYFVAKDIEEFTKLRKRCHIGRCAMIACLHATEYLKRQCACVLFRT